MVENLLMFFDEVRDRLIELNILGAEQIDEQQRRLRELQAESLPPAWGIYRVVCEV